VSVLSSKASGWEVCVGRDLWCSKQVQNGFLSRGGLCVCGFGGVGALLVAGTNNLVVEANDS
jgi:hypothetical protein